MISSYNIITIIMMSMYTEMMNLTAVENTNKVLKAFNERQKTQGIFIKTRNSK